MWVLILSQCICIITNAWWEFWKIVPQNVKYWQSFVVEDLAWVIFSMFYHVCVWICGFYFPVNVSSFFTVRKEECHSYYWIVLCQWPNNSGSPKATWFPKYLWSREHLNNMPQMMLEKAKNSFSFLKLHIILFLFKLCFDQFAYCTFSFLPMICGFTSITNHIERKTPKANRSAFILRTGICKVKYRWTKVGFLIESLNLSDYLFGGNVTCRQLIRSESRPD